MEQLEAEKQEYVESTPVEVIIEEPELSEEI
jgi:hypothetical protein